MKPIYWLLLILSAVCYPLSVVGSTYFWWLAFFFPIPLFYVTAKERVTPFQGFVWGLIAMGLHLAGVFIGIDTYATKSSYLARLVPGILTVLYCALYTTIWFWLTQKVKQWLSATSPAQSIALWAVSLWLFIFFADRGILWVCGRWEGYFLFHPIISLAHYPALLRLLPYAGKNILSLLMYLVAGASTLFILEKNTRSALLLFFSLLPWLVSIVLPKTNPGRPAWLNKIVTFPATFSKRIDLTNQAREVQQYFKNIAHHKPQAEVIIMPESSYYCDFLSKSPDLCKLWSSEYLGRPMHLILGSFRWDESSHYLNSLHWIFDGTLQDVADKRHAMVLLERLPTLLDFGIMRHLFYKDFPGITPATRERPRFAVLQEVAFVPYICSELFFNEHPDDSYTDGVILSSSNDSWTHGSYISNLMHLAALFKAIQWQRDILYVSFNFATYFDRYGNPYPLENNH